MKKRLLSLVLALVMLCTMLPTTSHAAASNDYTQWKQYDSEWNQQAVWPAGQYPNATLHYMSQAGCLVTSIAMLLRHYNVITTADVNSFNPWICNEKLKSVGALNNAADLIFADVAKAYPGFVYKGVKSYSLANLTGLYNSGYACIVKVSGSGGYYHYVAVRSINGSSVTIMDPGANNTALSYYGGVHEIYYYSATPSEPPLIAKTYPAYCSIKVSSSTTYIKSLPCSEKTDASSTNVEVASKGDQYQAIGLVENSAGNLWYKVQAKNGKTGYMYAGDTTYVAQSVSDIKGSGITAPTNHKAGATYVLTGTVSSTYNQLTAVSAYVYAGNSEQGTKETGASASVSDNSYSLGGSAIDNQTEFNILPVGTHTYVVWASYKNYYAKSATTLGTNTGEIGIYKATFNVTSGTTSCSHSYTAR